MPKEPANGPLRLTTRRALCKWIRRELPGECRVERIRPQPVVWNRKLYTVLPKPRPRLGVVELSVRPDGQPAHARVVARRFELRLPNPRQWVCREDLELPRSFSSGVSRLDAVWDPVGLYCGDFWFSGPEMVVREHAPRIETIAPDWSPDSYVYFIPDGPAAALPPAWWLRAALEAGFGMVPVDRHGFAVSPALVAERSLWGWTFVERSASNLLNPLHFEVYFGSGGSVHPTVRGHEEPERVEALRSALVAAVEKVPALRVRSGNCEFSFDEWRRAIARRRAEEQGQSPDDKDGPRDERAGAVVIALRGRRTP